MTTRLHRIQIGQEIPDRAEYYNQMVDAADYANTQRDKEGAEVSDIVPYATASLMKKTEGGKVFERGQVVAIDTSLNDSTTNLDLFLERPIFEARPTAFNTDFGRIAVTYQSTDDQEVGYSFTTGIAIVRMHEKDFESQCEFADVFEDGSLAGFNVDNTFMQTHWSGSWQIMYRDVNSAELQPKNEGKDGFAIVVHKGLQQRELKAKTIDSMPRSDVPRPVNVLFNALPTGGTVQAVFNYIGQETIGPRREILIKWFNDELRWVVVAAECE